MWPFRKRTTMSPKQLLAFLDSVQTQLRLHRESSQKLTEAIRTQNEAMKELIAGMRELDQRLGTVSSTCNNRYDRQANQINEHRRRIDSLKGIHGA